MRLHVWLLTLIVCALVSITFWHKVIEYFIPGINISQALQVAIFVVSNKSGIAQLLLHTKTLLLAKSLIIDFYSCGLNCGFNFGRRSFLRRKFFKELKDNPYQNTTKNECNPND